MKIITRVFPAIFVILASCELIDTVATDNPDKTQIDEDQDCLSLLQPGIAFGNIPLGYSFYFDMELTNDCDTNLTLTNIRFSSNNPPTTDFYLDPVPEFPFNIGPSETTYITIWFAPKQAGIQNDKLDIYLGDATEPTLEFSLEGQGASWTDCLTAQPEELDFGAVYVGDSKELTYTLFNKCSVPVLLEAILWISYPWPFNDFDGDGFGEGDPSVISPGVSVQKTVLFTPSMHGHQSDTLCFYNEPFLPELGLEPDPILTLVVSGDGKSYKDEYQQNARPLVDILFVIDNSGSMADEQDNLADSAADFINLLTEDLDYDFHIGITTTGMESQDVQGRLIGTPRFLQPSTPDLAVILANNLRLGSDGSPLEESLNSMVAALTPPMSTNWNADFSRSTAWQSVIIVSDENDTSSGEVADLVAEVQSQKSEDMETIINVLTYENGCIGGDPAPRLIEAATITQGYTGDLCVASSYLDVMVNFRGEDPSPNFGLRRIFPLSTTQELEGTDLIVFVDGNVTDLSWQYNVDTKSVVFEVAPSAGSLIEILY